MLAKFTELKNINVMSKEKVELRKEVFMFMEKQGHELKLSLDGSPIPYGIVNHLIASFHEHKMEELSKFSQHDVSGRSEQFVCGANRVMGEKRCEKQCGQCEELYPQTNCH